MPLPPNVHQIMDVPPMEVLEEAVYNKLPEDVVLPTWKLKPKLGVYSPTPQYQPLAYREKKPQWMRRSWIKKRHKKYYRKQMYDLMERESRSLRYLPDPSNRLQLAGSQVVYGSGVFKVQEQVMWKTLRKMSTDDLVSAMNSQRNIRVSLASSEVMLNERPGWQITAIKALRETLKRIDVVIEVRDARIPWTTAHPDLPGWVRPKPRVIVLARADLVPRAALEETMAHIRESERDRGVPVIPVDAQRGGEPIEALRLELMKAGAYVNRRRRRKGVNPRAIRTIMLGFPNVGKSSLINRLAGRKVAKRTGWAGSTKKLTWHKIGGYKNTELEFLDGPGNIPFGFGKRFTVQQQELMCMCRMFSDKIIDREQTAYSLVYLLAKLAKENPSMVESTVWRETKRMYGVDFQAALKREEPFFPERVKMQNPEPYCGKLLHDFNKGFWGKVQLEVPPMLEELRQDWSHVLNGKGENPRDLPAIRDPMQKALPPPGVALQLPTESLREKFERPREKLPAFAINTPEVKLENGLFDGW